MKKSSSFSVRIDPKLKNKVEKIYAQYGLSLTNAINIFLYQSCNLGGLPFELCQHIPNRETIEEGEKLLRQKKYSTQSVEEFFEEISKEC